MADGVLAKLDEIAWDEFHDPCGLAGAIPGLLRLVAEGGEESDFAELAEHLFHQEAVHEASAAAIPFLWQFLPGWDGKRLVCEIDGFKLSDDMPLSVLVRLMPHPNA